MPNWKKIALSGSSPEFSSLSVDTSVTASSITSTSGSVDNLTANDKLQLGGAGSQFFAYNEDTIKVKFANWYSSNDRQYGMGQLWYETWFAAIDNQAGRDNRRIGFYLEEPSHGANDADGGSGQHPTNSRFYVDINGAYLSGSLQVTGGITGSSFTGSLLSTNGVLSSSAQIATDISGSITSTSSSIASDIASLVSFSSSLETTIYDYTGSFTGDGSGLTGVTTNLTEEVTVSQTFTSATTASVSHLFGTKDVIVTVYDSNDDQFIPSRVNTPDTNTAVVYMDPATTGRVVVAKGGHLVSGSIYKEIITGVTSSVITHNLQEEFPVVQLYESASREMFIPETIKSVDANNTQIILSELIDCYVVIKR